MKPVQFQTRQIIKFASGPALRSQQPSALPRNRRIHLFQLAPASLKAACCTCARQHVHQSRRMRHSFESTEPVPKIFGTGLETPLTIDVFEYFKFETFIVEQLGHLGGAHQLNDN